MSPLPAPHLVGVYRSRNAAHVLDLVRQAASAGWTTAWWALDEVPTDLEQVTAGAGRGPKMALVNRLLGAHGDQGGTVVVSDDDVTMRPGSLARLVRTGDRAGLGLYQPGHVRGSCITYRFTLRRYRLRARWTTFVEIGPVFVVAGEVRDRVLPLPEDMGMGWGLELLWRDLADDGVRLGIVDGVGVRHLVWPKTHYDTTQEQDRVDRLVAERGLTSMVDAQQTLGRWGYLRPRPAWT